MIFIKYSIIWMLWMKFSETTISPNVQCFTNGEVHLHHSSHVSNMTSTRSEFMFASSETKVCDQSHVTGDVLMIHGCPQPDITSPVDVFLRAGLGSLIIYRINCLPVEHVRHQETYLVVGSHNINTGYLTDHDPPLGRRRRQDVSEDDKTGIRNFQTSVSFAVKLNFSSNDEISIACNPDNLGILYVSNPDPDNLTHVLSFSELTKKKCNSDFIEGRRFVAIGGCSLNFPITISFNSNNLATIIGGSHFKVYNVTCSEKPTISRGNLYPDRSDIQPNDGVNQCTHSFFVTMVTLVLMLLNLI